MEKREKDPLADGSANGERCVFEYTPLDLISNARVYLTRSFQLSTRVKSSNVGKSCATFTNIRVRFSNRCRAFVNHPIVMT